MGQTARAAGSTKAVREWAARLATRAAPRDYVGQLRELYQGILERWRYVQEPDEWIHGSARSLLEHVAGVKYNAPAGVDATQVGLHKVPTKEKGWGDCDDVSTLAAAGVYALGMTPYFRVARGDMGAHVSVIARTPRGEYVSIDPVGHPEHEFGWALKAPDVAIFDMDARPTSDFVMGATRGLSGVENMYGQTAFMGFDGMAMGRDKTHWCAVPMGDTDGPRVLALPMRAFRLASRGIMLHGTEAVDELGKQYKYDAGRDLWISKGYMHPYSPMGSRESRRARRKRRRARVRRVFRRVVQKVRGGLAKIMQSPIAQNAVGLALQAIGVPRRLTKGVLAAAGEILKKGGIVGLIRLLRKNPKEAARLVASAAKQGLRAAVKLFGPEVETGDPVSYLMSQNGSRQFVTAPVMALTGVPYMYELGEITVSPTPVPGSWYKIQKGDNLLKVAGTAYGLKAGGERLKRARWINQAQANQYAFDPTSTDNLFKSGKVSFMPRFHDDPEQAIQGAKGSSYATIWIPEAAGDEPPPQTPDIPETPQVEPETPDIPPEPEKPVEPQTPDLPDPEPDLPPEVEPDLPEIPPEPPQKPQLPKKKPPGTPTDAEFIAACRRVGGNPVQDAAGKWGCVRCTPDQIFDPGQNRCVQKPPTIPPTLPEIEPEIPPMPKSCPPGQVWNEAQQQCVFIPPTKPPTIPPTLPEIEPEIPPMPKSCPPGQVWSEVQQQCLVKPPQKPQLPNIPPATGGGATISPAMMLTALFLLSGGKI